MRITPRLRQLMRDYADYLRSDQAVTDDFLSEGMTFQECLELMDKVAEVVLKAAKEPG